LQAAEAAAPLDEVRTYAGEFRDQWDNVKNIVLLIIITENTKNILNCPIITVHLASP
jgi:hypothetical protein